MFTNWIKTRNVRDKTAQYPNKCIPHYPHYIIFNLCYENMQTSLYFKKDYLNIL